MIEDLPDILHRLIGQKGHLQVRFPESDIFVPALVFNVSFPRLEIVLEGRLNEQGLPLAASTLTTLQVLYVQAGKWTLPQWTGPATTLSILFGWQKPGLSIQCWDGKSLHTKKQNVSRPGSCVGSYPLLSLNEVSLQSDPLTARLVTATLLSHCREQLVGLEMRVSHSRDLPLTVQDYLEGNLSLPLTRESVARRFHITPNYLLHIFQKPGSVEFNEYLACVRLEKVKQLLRGYGLKVKETAYSCGSVDSNYFCRVFKRYTERLPSEYR